MHFDFRGRQAAVSMLIRREGGAFLQGGGFFPCTIEGICKDGNAPPVNVPTARGGLVLDVGIGDAVGFGVVLGVGVREDAEGEVGAISKSVVAYFGNTAQLAHAR